MAKKIISILLSGIITVSAFAAGASRYVSVQSLAIREKSSNTSKTLATASYGDELTLIKESGKWAQVSPKSNPSVKGWVSTSALSKRKIVAGKSVNTDANEISLAGKGFAEGLENQDSSAWDTDNPAVDSIEGNTVSDAERQAFIKEGRLKEAE